MCKKKLFSIIYPFLRGAVQKWRFFRKTFYGAFFQILVAQSTASPTTLCACRTDRNSWRNTSSKINTYQKLFVQCENPEQNEFWNRSPASANRFQKFFLRFFYPLWTCLMIFSQKTPQKNLDREIRKLVGRKYSLFNWKLNHHFLFSKHPKPDPYI